MKLHEKIAYYRRDRRLSQEELAAQVGVSRQAVSKWELGEASPDVGKLLALARAFGVTTDHLLSEEEAPAGAAPPPAAPPPPGAPPLEPDRFSRFPGLLERMIRRWGWLAGLYIALIGLGPTLFGVIGLILVSSASQTMSSMGWETSPFLGASGGGTVYVDGVPYQIEGMPGASRAPSALSGMAAIPAIFLVIGLGMIALGLILAFVLWKKGNGEE